jgi:hypothetical protein
MLRSVRLTAAALAIVLVAGTARADDVAQIEKATDLARTADTWCGLNCFDKSNESLAAAEKAIAGVDETGKAETVAKIKEIRDKIAAAQQNWNADSFKSLVERQISAAESDGEHGSDGYGLQMDRAQAMLADSWTKAHLDAAVIGELQKKIEWTKKKVDSVATRDLARRLDGELGRTLGEADRALEAAQQDSKGDTISNPDSYKPELDRQIGRATETLSKDENKKALGADKVAEFQKRIDTLKSDFAKAAIEIRVHNVQVGVDWIQSVLDGKQNAYTNNVEDRFKAVNEAIALCPANDPRVTAFKDKLAQQRKIFDAGQAQGARDELVKPAVDYWKYCQENYKKDGEGWEGETTPRTLKEFLHHSPASLGCDKTEKFLREVVQRFLEDDRLKKALAKYPNDPELKKTNDEATGLLEKAGGKMCSFAAKILDEAEKLPAGQEREEMVQGFYNFKVTLKNAAQGCSAYAGVVARIDGLDKRFGQEKAQGEAAKAELEKKMLESVAATWPDLIKPWEDKVKKIDANAAVENIGAWKGTVIRFTGGGPGVNLNRSGWSWWDEYDFIVTVDGVPVCGNLDSGLAEAIAAVEKQTGTNQINCAECIGIVDGVCKAHERFKNPLNENEYLRSPPRDGVKFRIVAWNACNIAAACGQGTSLKKLSEFKEVSVNEAGSTGSGGHSSSSGGGGAGTAGHWIHRFVAWGMCALLGLIGLLAVAHGASKFVPQIEEQKVKLGDYLGYTGAGFVVIGIMWFGAAIVLWVLGMCELGSLPSVAMIFAGASVAIDIARAKGKLAPDTASMIQPVAILFGLGAFLAAAVHFLFWDVMLL